MLDILIDHDLRMQKTTTAVFKLIMMLKTEDYCVKVNKNTILLNKKQIFVLQRKFCCVMDFLCNNLSKIIGFFKYLLETAKLYIYLCRCDIIVSHC